MMKILYIEDELSKNIPRIIRLFSKYLSKKQEKNLRELEADETGYGASPDEIKEIVERTGLIEIEYRFPSALRKILQHHEQYALFIVDRNLSDNEYDFDELKQIDTAYTETQYDKFFEREGDYLLHKLVYSNVDIKNTFYFLTAYPAPDEIRGVDELKTLIDFGQFHTNNFIEKGNSDQIENLQSIIENIKILSIREENKQHLHILQKNINEETAERFLNILDETNREKSIGNNLSDIRIIYENIISVCSRKIPDMRDNCTDTYGNVILGQSTIDWLTNNSHINSILRNFFFSINKICSEFGAHSSRSSYKYKPTVDTVNSLVYAMKDVILWFGQICSQYPDKTDNSE